MLWHLLIFELKYNIKNIYKYIYIYGFFVLSLIICVFAADTPEAMASYGHMPLWLSIVLGVMLMGSHCFERDMESGFIQQIQLTHGSLEAYVTAKAAILALMVLGPALALIPLAQGLGLQTRGLLPALPLAGMAILAIMLLVAAITAGMPKACAMMQLLALPWAVPVIIFASDAARQSSADADASLLFLVAVTGTIVPLSLMISARCLRG